MAKSSILASVKRNLGYPLVNIETDDATLTDIIGDSTDRLNTYRSSEGFLTVVASSGMIDLSLYPQIHHVTGIMRVPDGDESGSSDLSGVLSFGMGGNLKSVSGGCYNNSQGRLSDRVALYKSHEKMVNTLQEKISYQLVGDKLLISPNLTRVTLEFVQSWTSESDIDDFWRDRIIVHATSTTKIFLGQARSKYKSQKALHEVKGDGLIQEGKSELEQLMKEIKDGDLGYAEWM